MAIIDGTDFGETLTGTGGADQISGFGGNDSLFGCGGDDTLDGGTGIDAMFGGTGNDEYFVDDPGDTVVENTNAGEDTVHVAMSYTLQSNVENLVLTEGAGPISGTGNDL